MTPLEGALDWIRRGYFVIPIPFREKGSKMKGWQNLRIKEDDLPHYFNGEHLNIGVLQGDEDGATDVDLDCREALSTWAAFAVKTELVFGHASKRASHHFYRSDPPVKTKKYVDPTDKSTIIELRGQTSDGMIGLQTVVPPSMHECGEEISFEPEGDREPANVDAEVLQLAVAKTAAAALLARHWPAAGHGRHNCELALAGVLARAGWNIDDARVFATATYRAVSDHDRSALSRVAKSVEDTYQKHAKALAATGVPTLAEAIDKKVVSTALGWLGLDLVKRTGGNVHKVGYAVLAPEAGAGAIPDLLHFPFTDSGNAERLVAVHGTDLRFCADMKKWGTWDGRRWVFQDARRVKALAKRTIRLMYAQAAEIQDKGLREAAEKHARRSESAAAINSMLSCAEYEDGLSAAPHELDTDPYSLNFLNGTVDLRTGALKPHRQEDLITKLIQHEYRPDATCTLWLDFLDQIMGGGSDASEDDLERAQSFTDYLQRALGYSLTGRTIEKAVFMPFGPPDTGKSTMLSTIRSAAKEYSMLLQVDTLMTRQESNNTQADLADLRGARFVQTSETEEGQRIAQGKLKRISQGMGDIKATRKWENPITFPETHKLWIDTNKKPTIRDAEDRATFNRFHPIPFTVKIAKIDRDMPAKLLREAPGILAWLVEGARLWHESGLQRPVEVEEARNQWRAEMDKIGRFIEECCIMGVGFKCPASALYAAFKNWAEAGGEKDVINAMVFGTKLSERDGIAKGHTRMGTIYSGIELRCEPIPEGTKTGRL
jgi:P4 family phage/plasmid primase-like protien